MGRCAVRPNDVEAPALPGDRFARRARELVVLCPCLSKQLPAPSAGLDGDCAFTNVMTAATRQFSGRVRHARRVPLSAAADPARNRRECFRQSPVSRIGDRIGNSAGVRGAHRQTSALHVRDRARTAANPRSDRSRSHIAKLSPPCSSPPAGLATPFAGTSSLRSAPAPLLLFSRAYADPAPRARPGPRFECARDVSGEIDSDLLVASGTTSACRRRSDDPTALPSARAGRAWLCPASRSQRVRTGRNQAPCDGGHGNLPVGGH
jgi:hypothetical protein